MSFISTAITFLRINPEFFTLFLKYPGNFTLFSPNIIHSQHQRRQISSIFYESYSFVYTFYFCWVVFSSQLPAPLSFIRIPRLSTKIQNWSLSKSDIFHFWDKPRYYLRCLQVIEEQWRWRDKRVPLTLEIRLQLQWRSRRFATSASLPRTIFFALDSARATPFREWRDRVASCCNPLLRCHTTTLLITLRTQIAEENRTTLHSAIFHSSILTREIASQSWCSTKTYGTKMMQLMICLRRRYSET